MLTIIKSHCRVKPALSLGPWYLVTGSMLRCRAIYLHRKSVDQFGHPCIGAQVLRAIVSGEYATTSIVIGINGRNWVDLKLFTRIKWIYSLLYKFNSKYLPFSRNDKWRTIRWENHL